MAVLQACDQCSSIKQKCDGESPCSRCHRLELDCAHLRSHGRQHRRDKTLVRHEGPQIEPQRSYKAATVRRDRTGCDTCKQRKKKCDELKPKCSDCQRLNLLCVRTASKTTARAQRLFRQAVSTPTHSEPANSYMHTSQAVITSPSSDYKSSAGSLDGVILHDDKFKDQPNAVYQWLATDGSDFSRRDNFDVFDSLILEDSEAPFLKFDAADMPDFLYEKSSHSSPDWFSTEPITIPYNPTLLPLDQLSNRQDQHLLQHYTQIVSRSLCIASTDEDNPFLKYIMPLASTSPAVMGAVLTLSAAHLKHNGGYPETVERSLKHQTKALAALNELIASGSSTTNFKEHALAAILLFCIIDIREGNSSRWHWHVAAAKVVITSVGQSPGSSTTHSCTWAFLLDIFEYVDSIITISKCRPPLMAHDKLQSEDENGQSDDYAEQSASQIPKSEQYNTIFGVARPLFRLIGQISALSSRRKYRSKPLFDLRFRQSATIIERKLRAWIPPVTIIPSSHATMSSSWTLIFERELREAEHAALAIKWASILRLHQIVDGYDLPHPTPNECLRNILLHVAEVRVGSAVESLLVFPLIMAGSVALSKEDRMTIRSRWLIIERTIGFGNIANGGQLQEQVWKAMDEELQVDSGEPGKVTVNWAKIRWYDFSELVLF